MATVTFNEAMPEGGRLRDLFVAPSAVVKEQPSAATYQVPAFYTEISVSYIGARFDSDAFAVSKIRAEGAGAIWLEYDSSDAPTQVAGRTLAAFQQGGIDTAAFLMSGDDSIEGSSRQDFLETYAGNDTLDGGASADTMEGGSGDDLYYVDNTNDRTTERAGEGRDTVLTSVGFALAYTDDVEILRASGSAYAIALTGSGTSNSITGTDGNDTLDGAGGNDTLLGGLGNDTYIVNSPYDVLVEAAGAGYDTVLTRTDYALAPDLEVLKAIANTNAVWLTGNALDNLIVGNTGKNVIQGLDGNDQLFGDGGDDQIYGGGGSDILFGGIGSDALFGEAANDTLFGDVGKDYLSGGDGEDILYGGVDDDTMRGDNGNDLLYGDVGNDRLYGDAGNDKLYGGLGKNTLYGGGGNDIVYGGMHADNIYGDAGNDKVFGDAGNDTINGGLGNDALSGGPGKDSFTFTTKLNSTKNIDRISDFSTAGDRFRLDDAVFKGIGHRGGLSADAFHIGASAQDASDRVIYNSGNGTLYYDRDGSGPAAQIRFAILKKGLALDHSDFFIV